MIDIDGGFGDLVWGRGIGVVHIHLMGTQTREFVGQSIETILTAAGDDDFFTLGMETAARPSPMPEVAPMMRIVWKVSDILIREEG